MGVRYGFIQTKKDPREYGFVKKDGSKYIGMLTDEDGEKIFTETDLWQEMATWPSLEEVLAIKEEFEYLSQDWELVRVEGLMLTFSAEEDK